MNLKRLGYSQDLTRLPKDGEPENIQQVRKLKDEMPRYKVAKNDKYFDFLLQLLDLHKEVNQRATELLNMLVTHPVILKSVQNLSQDIKNQEELDIDNQEILQSMQFDWSSVFDSKNVHKMHYSLEILEAIMIISHQQENQQNEEKSIDNMMKWVKKFINLGGIEELQKQLKEALERLSESKKSAVNWKKVIDQLLKLIRMFVVTATSDKEIQIQENKDQIEQNQIQLQEITSNDEIKSSQNKRVNFQEEEKEDVHQQTVIQETQNELQKEPTSIQNFEVTKEFLFGEDQIQIDEESHANKQATLPISAKSKTISDSGIQQQDDSSLELMKVIMRKYQLGAEVMKRIDIQLLQQQVIQVVNLQLASDELQKEDKLIVESALGLWEMLIKESRFVKSASQVQIDQQFLIKGILTSKDYKVRENFQQTFYQISKQSQNLKSQILQILIQQLQKLTSATIEEKANFKTQHFFGLFVLLAKQINDSLPEEKIYELLAQLIKNLKLHSSIEKRNQLIIDSTLKGYLDLISTILDGLYTTFEKEKEKKDQIFEILNQQNLVDHLYNNCLFEIQNSVSSQIIESKNLQCCSSESRKSAYKVLESLQKFMSPIEMVKYFQNYLEPILKNIERPSKWRHSPSNKGRTHQHCGIVNLGCICYMISMLQQFFMVPQFRYQLLKAIDNSPELLVEYKEEKIDDNMLRQLQKLFGFLELSERQAYNPKEFCFAFKEFDGTPTKIGEQKDSQEFLNIFFDRIEHSLKQTSQKYLLQDVFLGNQCSQMICQQCGQVKNRIEQFYNLSLQVKGSIGIYDSLNKLVFGQTIEDYNCDGCNKKVNIMKRSLLADMPNTLIVHLQRIMFSFDTMQNDKINTRFEFPTILDLKEYSYKHVMTKENAQNLPEEHANLLNIQDDDYIYRLVGVNVHVGTADHGHYYSLIDIKRGLSEIDPYQNDQNGENMNKKWAYIQSDPWKTFNDDKVGLFDFDKNIKEEAFGCGGDSNDMGKTSDAMTDAELAAFLSTGSKTYGKSAYMLIYERKSKKNLREVILPSKDQNQQENIEIDQEEKIENIEFRQLQKFVPQWIQDLVNKDNKTFVVDSQMFNDHFFDYLKSIFKLIGSDMVMTSHQYDYQYNINFQNLKQISLNIGGKILFDMLCYFDHNSIISDFCSNLETIILFTDSPMALESGERSLVAEFVNEYFLKDGCDHFFKIMFNCIDPTSRKCAGLIAGKAISRLFKIYNEVKPELRDSNEAIKEVKDTIDKITDLLILVLQTKECQKNWSKLESYFKVLLTICTQTISQAQYMLEKQDIIAEIIDFVLGNQSPRMLKTIGEKRVAMGGTVRPPFQPLFILVSHLVRMTHTQQMDLENREKTHADTPFITKYESHKTYFLSDESRQMLEETEFLDKGLQDNNFDENKEYCMAIAHLCYKNLKFSRKYIYKLIKAISFSDNDQIKRYLSIVEDIALLKDEYQIHRLEYLFGYGFIMNVKHTGEDLLQYGEQVHKENKIEDIFQIFTTVDAKVYDDSLLNMLLKYKSRMDSFTLSCLQSLCTLIVNDKDIGLYFSRLPAADYEQQRYTDWIKSYLDFKLIDIRKYASSSGSKEKEEMIIKIISLFSQYEDFLKELEKNNLQIENQNHSIQLYKHYVIKRVVSEMLVESKNFGEAFKLEINQISCEWSNEKNVDIENIIPKSQDKTEPQENNQESLQQDIDQSDQQGKINEQQIENIQIQQKQIETFICQDLLYRLTITNNLEIGIKLNINFSINTQDSQNKNDNKNIEQLNIELPISGLTDYLKPSQTANIITLRKKNPDLDFDINQLEISISHEPYHDNDYQMGSYASQTNKPVPLTSQNNENNKNKVTNAQTGRRNGVLGELVPARDQGYVVVGNNLLQALEYEKMQQDGYIDQEFQGVGTATDFEGTEKECPTCTFLNPIIYNVCDMCGAEFN